MKNYFLILLILFCVDLVNAQVGVNTKSPLGMFHIDASGNNSVLPSALELRDDFIVKSDGGLGVGIGIGTIPAEGASVDLASSNKGLSLNEVALTGVGDLSTVPSPVQGMMVFNTSTNSELYPGICVFNGLSNRWEQMAFTKETNLVQIAVSLYDVTTTSVTASQINAGEYSGVSIPFAPLGSATTGIKIMESGTYAFALNLMGMVNTNITEQTHLYLFMMRKSDMTIMDATALGVLFMNNPPQYKQSATAILSSELEAGDELEFLISHNLETPHSWTLYGGAISTAGRYNKTSLSYWKL